MVPRVEPGVALPADHLVTVVLLGQQPEEQEHLMIWQASTLAINQGFGSALI
jgi:hypothetical protein